MISTWQYYPQDLRSRLPPLKLAKLNGLSTRSIGAHSNALSILDNPSFVSIQILADIHTLAIKAHALHSLSTTPLMVSSKHAPGTKTAV